MRRAALPIPVLCLVALMGCQNRATSAGTDVLAPLVTVEASVVSGVVPLEVVFEVRDEEGGDPAGLVAIWDFGDGSDPVTDINPTHTFEGIGVFEVVVVATNAGGRDTASVQIEVVGEIAVDEVTATPDSGIAPLEVVFGTTVEGGTAPLTFAWDFGDGETSTDENPTHTFADPGEFEVSVKVTGSKGELGMGTVQVTVEAGDTPLVGVTAIAEPESGAPPLEVKFSADVEGGVAPLTFAWDFGDGNTSEEPEPVHNYEDVGVFTASVTVRDGADDEVVGEVVVEVVDDGGTILDVLEDLGDHTILLDGLAAAGLDGLLSSPDELLTVFAPTDEAFNLLEGLPAEELLMSGDALVEILNYHILSGVFLEADLEGLASVTTEQGGDIAVSSSPEGTFLNGSVGFVVTDIGTTNGTIHVIDAVLNPTSALLCDDFGPHADGFIGNVPCSVDLDQLELDLFAIDVQEGDCVHVFADNINGNSEGNADILAVVLDENGIRYGLAEGFAELDDEIPCTNEPVNGFACPDAAITAALTGSLTIGVAQLPGACDAPSPYTLFVAVNGVDINLGDGPVVDDGPLP